MGPLASSGHDNRRLSDCSKHRNDQGTYITDSQSLGRAPELTLLTSFQVPPPPPVQGPPLETHIVQTAHEPEPRRDGAEGSPTGHQRSRSRSGTPGRRLPPSGQ